MKAAIVTHAMERARPPYADPVWDQAARIYGFLGMPDIVTLGPFQMEIIERGVAAITAAVEAEREACAEIADGEDKAMSFSPSCRRVAAAIRSRTPSPEKSNG